MQGRTFYLIVFLLTLIMGFFFLFMIEMPQYFTSLTSIISEIRLWQRELHQSLANAVRITQERSVGAFWSLVGLSFVYGVFHAAGPGHGKMIIATYLATHKTKLKKGIFLSFVSAALQGVTAIITVEITVGLLKLTLADANSTSQTLERVSYVLIAVIGLIFMLAAYRRFLHKQHNHDHCDHSHLPDPDASNDKIPIVNFLSMVLSIGIRPCAGSVLVLIFATILKLKVAGIVSVLAISFGTAITVSTLAALAVYARATAEELLKNMPTGNMAIAHFFNGAALVGGLFIFLFGVALFLSTRGINNHPIL